MLMPRPELGRSEPRDSSKGDDTTHIDEVNTVLRLVSALRSDARTVFRAQAKRLESAGL